MKTSKNFGAIDWLMDVFFLLKNGSTSHSCHVTDKNADGYVGGKKRECDGIKMMKLNQDTGVYLHKNAYPNFKSFFQDHVRAIQSKYKS